MSGNASDELETIAKSLDNEGCPSMATECREIADGFRRIDKILNSL